MTLQSHKAFPYKSIRDSLTAKSGSILIDGSARRAVEIAVEDCAGHQERSNSCRAKVAALSGDGAEGSVRKSILALLDAADNDMTKARQNIEGWFNDVMKRASGCYKRMAQLIIIVPAVVVTLVENVDSIDIGNRLYRDNSLRALAVAAAQNYTNYLAVASATSSNSVADPFKAVSSAVNLATNVQGKTSRIATAHRMGEHDVDSQNESRRYGEQGLGLSHHDCGGFDGRAVLVRHVG